MYPKQEFNEIIPIKTEIYKYFREKLIQKESDRQNITLSPTNISTTWQMIMLYFTCLISVKDDDIGLFNIFNCWAAYKDGPFEVDAYNIYCNDDGRKLFVEYIEKNSNLFKTPFSTITNYKDIIDDSLDYLYSFNKELCSHFKPDFIDRNQLYYLINMIHYDLYLWKNVINTENKILDLSISELIKEKNLFINFK